MDVLGQQNGTARAGEDMKELMSELFDEPEQDRNPSDQTAAEEGEYLAPEAAVRKRRRRQNNKENNSEGEEGRKPEVIQAPQAPSQKEREEHEATHCPYKSWCAHCVRGRGRNKPHKQPGKEQREERKEGVSRIAFDYFFMTEEDKDQGTPQ